jgi:hypothetical protein
MKNRELYVKDPGQLRLLNNGVAEVAEVDSDDLRRTLRFELETFVCEGEYEKGLNRILETFLTNLGQPEQPAVWTSGFYGCGKSHLVKMLRHLWVDFCFPEDGVTARGLAHLPTEVEDNLKELSTAGKRYGGLRAASGKLGAGAGDSLRLAVLSIIFASVGLPREYPAARFVIWLKQNGFYDTVRSHVEAQGKQLEQELRHLYVSPHLADGLLIADPNFAPSASQVKGLIKEQFLKPTDITDDEMLAVIRDVLAGPDGKLPCTLFVFDEIQQYIGDSAERSRQVYEIAEALSKHLDGRVLIVGTGQSALTDTPLLQKVAGRFPVRIHLSDSDVETVTRKMILLKKPDRINVVKQTLDTCDGEVSRHLRETDIGPRTEDRENLVADYPLLPVRRRFWEQVLRAVDPFGTAAQLRTQLRIVYEAARSTGESPVGTVIPGDFIYEQIAQDLLQSGVLLREIHENIEQHRKDGSKDGQLRARLCSLIYLIGRLPREQGSDIGVRANADSLADLLVEDLPAGSAALRKEVADTLKKMTDAGKLMQIGDEYQMQTEPGRAWEGEFQERRSRLLQNDQQMASLRADKLRQKCDASLEDIRLLHGKSKVSRKIEYHYGAEPPKATGLSVPIWIRDGWSDSLKSVEDDARQFGTGSPVVFCFIERRASDDLKHALAEWKAAVDTLEIRGEPSSPEGKEARRAMKTRENIAEGKLETALNEIFKDARVFQGGGTEFETGTLAEKVEAAATASLARLFLNFGDADDARWRQVFDRARQGDTNALEAIDYTGDAAKHAVCSAILMHVGPGKKGKDIRSHFAGIPCGWPQDAVDATLVLLTLTEHLQAQQNEKAVQARQLDQSKIGPAQFRVENRPLSAPEKVKLRKLFQAVGINCKPNEEVTAADRFLRELEDRAAKAGGEAPLPARPDTTHVSDLSQLTGNEQLAALLAVGDRLTDEARQWEEAAELATKRAPRWQSLQRLSAFAEGLPVVSEVRPQVDAILQQRCLLGDPDPVPPLCDRLTQVLRENLVQAQQAYQKTHQEEMESLAATEPWQKLPDDQRRHILVQNGIDTVPEVKVGTEQEVSSTLQATPLHGWSDRRDALPRRFEKARIEAARRLEPKAVSVKVMAATLKTPDDVELWIDHTRQTILERLKEGPVIIG